MAISPEMQIKLDRIESLIENGYSLQKKWGYYPDLQNSSGKSINIFGPLFRLSGPAGFSWVAFFFPWVVCVQIKEWSYFYFVGILALATTSFNLAFDLNNSPIGLLIGFSYANMFPYLRYMAAKQHVEEISVGVSIVLGFVLSIVVLIPSVVLTLFAG